MAGTISRSLPQAMLGVCDRAGQGLSKIGNTAAGATGTVGRKLMQAARTFEDVDGRASSRLHVPDVAGSVSLTPLTRLAKAEPPAPLFDHRGAFVGLSYRKVKTTPEEHAQIQRWVGARYRKDDVVEVVVRESNQTASVPVPWGSDRLLVVAHGSGARARIAGVCDPSVGVRGKAFADLVMHDREFNRALRGSPDGDLVLLICGPRAGSDVDGAGPFPEDFVERLRDAYGVNWRVHAANGRVDLLIPVPGNRSDPASLRVLVDGNGPPFTTFAA